MNALIEVSMYPLRDGYIEAIDEFLVALNQDPEIEVTTNRMSTQLFGDYDALMHLLKRATREAYERFGTAVFVYKVIPGAQRSIQGYE